MAEREIERWITVHGARVPIFKGQSAADAVKAHVGKTGGKKNEGEKQMPYAIGSHIGFCLNTDKENYTLVFDHDLENQKDVVLYNDKKIAATKKVVTKKSED